MCGWQEHVKREKQVMAECSCPFMVNLVASFKDAACLYMLLEAVMGGELFTYLQACPRLLLLLCCHSRTPCWQI